jgi:amidase
MNITDLSATALSQRIAQRKISPSEVMAAVLDQIDAVNPTVNAIVALRDRDELMAEAQAAGDVPSTGWLHGIPFAVKDLVVTRGIRTTWGSPLFADHVPEADDLLAARLRQAGAILIGKTNTPEWGQGSHSFNPVYGVTRNPYGTSRSAGGSSGGAAAALATHMLPVADGSDMMGSLRNPAAFCNVYGFRPSFGLVPRSPVGENFLSTLATDGPMGRNVEDVARLLQVIAGPHPGTPFGRESEPFADQLDVEVRGMRIGWLGDWGGAYPTEPGILELCREALSAFEGLGAVVEDLAPPFPAEDLWSAWITLRAMLSVGGRGALYEDEAKRAQLKPESQWEIEQGLTLSARAVYEASLIRSQWYAVYASLFERFDALVLPSAQVWPFPVEWRWPHEINGRPMDTYHRWMEIVVPISLVGAPVLGCPAGFGPGGLPMGFQLAGPVGGDAKVLALGQAYHRATDWPGQRPPPGVA